VKANDKSTQAALQWALERGSRSGRVAWQFARDYAGRAAASAQTKTVPAKALQAKKRK
jgi:uncharacterized protein